MKPDVQIEYCHPCGHLERAIDTQRAILTEFGRQLNSVSLLVGEKGVFKIRVDGDQIFDKSDGYDEAKILTDIRDRVKAAATT